MIFQKKFIDSTIALVWSLEGPFLEIIPIFRESVLRGTYILVEVPMLSVKLLH